VSGPAIQEVVVVGGGTAGWLAAGVLAAKNKQLGEAKIKVTLVESPNVASLGVGEGTWPSMRHTLQIIGINEQTFIQRCNVSLKQGSLFQGWVNGSPNDAYYHPFVTPPHYGQYDLAGAWQQLSNREMKFADFASVQSSVCELNLAPKQLSTPDYAGVTNYGYHLDAGKFAELLCEHCTKLLGVRHIKDHVTQVHAAKNGDVSHLSTKLSGNISGQLFVDCSGMNSLLIDQHYHIPFLNQEHVLFNDRALAAHVPYASDSAPILSATKSSAQTNGWIWDIGLQTRRGVGYTYSSQFESKQSAEDTLAKYINTLTEDGLNSSITPRTIKFTPGYREKFWQNNCVAVGMSSGFFEPLEASAIAMVELSLTMLSEQFPRNRQHMDIVAERFNERFTYRWQRVIDFLKLHYVLSERQDKYWLAHRDASSIPDSLQKLLDTWQFQAPSRYDVIQNEEVFPSASYQYVLYGMRYKRSIENTLAATTLSSSMLQYAEQLMQQNEQLKHQYRAGLPSNRTFINGLLGKVNKGSAV
jgi:flavin-dependent dehydrogenase